MAASGQGAHGQGFDGVERRGLMFVLSSPSGAGKTTLSRMLMQRPGGIEGKDYYFVDQKRFEQMVANGDLMEWAPVFGNRYGTPRVPVEAALTAGRDVLFDIDWQGTQQLREKARSDLVSVFVLPPSATELERRLHTRAQDSDGVIASRMAKAADEMSHWAEYDYVIINHTLNQAFAEVKLILAAERLKRARQTGLSDFVRRLQSEL